VKPRPSKGFVIGSCLAAALALLAAAPAAAHPVPPLAHQPDVRFCTLDYGFPPRDRLDRDAAITGHARGEVMVYAANLQKWWLPLEKRSDGKTVRDLHPGVKVIYYLSAAEFMAISTVHDLLAAPSGPTSYAHTRTFTVPEYLRIARRVGGPVPDLIDPKPYGFGDGILEFSGNPLTVRSNPGGADFIAYVRRSLSLIRKEGGDGLFLDNLSGPAWFYPGVTVAGGNPIRLPPWCFKMKDGKYYWQHEAEGRPVPSLADLRAGKPEALARVADLSSCRATGAPAEWKTITDLENAEMTLVRALKESGPGTVMFNGLLIYQAEHALRLLQVADGAMTEGFVVGQRPAAVAAALDLLRRAAKTGKWILVGDPQDRLENARLSYAAYLLVAAPNVCWALTGKVTEVPEMATILGPARGTYATLPEGEGRPDAVVYARRFERGEVYVNPQARPMPIPGGTIPARSGLVRPLGYADARF